MQIREVSSTGSSSSNSVLLFLGIMTTSSGFPWGDVWGIPAIASVIIVAVPPS